jgi:hypothetical protein
MDSTGSLLVLPGALMCAVEQCWKEQCERRASGAGRRAECECQARRGLSGGEDETDRSCNVLVALATPCVTVRVVLVE